MKENSSGGNIFVNRKVMAVSISILIALIGYISLNTLPIEQYPDIAPPTINITTSYTGADAQTVMSSVIMPIEEAVNGVPDMAYITSNASANGSVEIKVYFKQGTNADMAAVNVQNRVSSALGLMPQEVTKVGVKVEKQQNSILQMTALVSRDGRFDQEFIANYIDINVKPRIQRITGVGAVQNLGNTYSLRIWLKPDAMAQYGLTPDDVFAAIGRQNLVAPAGTLGAESENIYQYNLEYKGRLTTIDEFNEIVLRSTAGGNVLHLGDVAEVELGAIQYSFASSVDGEPGVVFIVNQAAGANATLVNASINDLYKDMQAQLPPGLEFVTLLTSDDFLFAAMHNVVETLIIAILLVILVVYFFLQDFKATLIPSISIIVSLLGTFAIVKVAGFSLNILTLFALVLAIGTVVDDAIVVVEAVMAKLENGYSSPRKATLDAMSEVTVAVISCTLVFMAVFIPTTFMSGTSGTFFTQFGITIASSVGLSCLCALTLCPALCVMLMRPKDESKAERKGLNYYTRLAYNASYNALLGKYKIGAQKFLKHPKRAWGILAIALVLMVWLMRTLPSGLVPQEDQGVILVDISAPSGYTLKQTDKVLDKVEARIKAIEEVEAYGRVAGFGIVSGTNTCYGTYIVRLKNWDERKGYEHYIDVVMGKIYLACEDIKEAQILAFQMPQIPGYGNSNAMELVLQDRQGGDMSAFNEVTNTFLAHLQERKEILMAMSTYSESFPKYKVEVNSVQCERAGISAGEVLSTLGTYCGGAYVSNFNQYGKVYRVMVSADAQYRLDPAALQNIFVRVSNGTMAPISQFVTLVPAVGSASLNRFNLYQSITCQVMPDQGYAQGDAMNAIKEVAEEYLPAGYGYEYGGMSRELAANAQSNTTTLIYAISILLIYLILACLYESWFIPFAVLLSVPFGLMGSFLFSWICGLDNNIYLQTGVIMLIGLLAKTAILITEFAVERHKHGLSIQEAAMQACEERFRPILMTVLTMIIGMIPLIIEGGAGANGNRSLAIGVVGGMAIGTVALLFIVPAFYIIFQNLHNRLQGSEEQELPATTAAAKPAVITLIVLSLTLSGCSLFKKFDEQPQLPTSAQAEAIADTLPTWQQMFTDPLLAQYIDSALVRNLDVRTAELQMQAAEQTMRAARLGYLPSLSLNPYFSATTTSGAGYAGSYDYRIPLQLNWGGQGFGTITNRLRETQAIYKQAGEQHHAMQIAIIADVAMLYAQLQLVDRQVAIIDSTIVLWSTVLDVQRTLMDNGKAYSTSVHQLEASLIDVRIQRLTLTDTRRELEQALCLILAQPYQPIATSNQPQIMGDTPLSKTDYPWNALMRRPDLRAAWTNVERAYYVRNQSLAAFMPALSLSGLLGWTSNGITLPNPGQMIANAIASLAQPVFQNGKLRANYRIAQINQEQARLAFTAAALKAGEEVNLALADCQMAEQKAMLYDEQLIALNKSFEGTQLLMRNGKASYLEVLVAQQALLQAQLAAANNLYEAAQAQIKLYLALGGGL